MIFFKDKANLKDKKVVITGATSGIGLELVKLLLEHQCHILAVGRDTCKIEFSHPLLQLYSCDISKSENVDQLMDYAMQKLRGIDIFIANAGFAYYEKIQEPQWEHASKIFDTNVLSVIYSLEILKRMKGDNPFSFVATASAVSFLPLPGYALYSSTKAALRAFAVAYRGELARGQHLQLVYPIATRTSFFAVAGGSPLPWPVQEAGVVARKIVRGIEGEQEDIYPSKLFYLLKVLGGIFPVFNKAYVYTQQKKFEAWQRNSIMNEYRRL